MLKDDDAEVDIEAVAEELEQEPMGQGQSALLSTVLRGKVQYAYMDQGFLTLMYEDPKRMMKINPTAGIVIQVPYYESTKH
jgi:hypothetical protein